MIAAKNLTLFFEKTLPKEKKKKYIQGMEISMAYFKGPMMEILPNIGFAAEIYYV